MDSRRWGFLPSGHSDEKVTGTKFLHKIRQILQLQVRLETVLHSLFHIIKELEVGVYYERIFCDTWTILFLDETLKISKK